MYNEELKTKFIKDYSSSKSTQAVCEAVFNAFEKHEQEWDADLCTKSAADLQPVIDSIVGFRVRSKWMRIIILKDYAKWCIGVANIPGACAGMLQINSVGLEKVRKQTVASPLHLQKYLDCICEIESMKTTDNIYRCYYWLAYGGAAEEDILNIKCSDVDFENMVVHCNDMEIPIYREAIPAFKNCVELTQFLFNHPNYANPIWKDRVKGDNLIRGLRSLLSIKSMRVELSRRAKAHKEKTDTRLSYFRTWISGVFYRMYEKELVGETPDFTGIVSKQMIGKKYKLDSGRNTMDAKRRQLVNDYKEDYQRWKLAFKI